MPILRPTSSGLAAKQTAKEYREAYSTLLEEFRDLDRRGSLNATDYARSRLLWKCLNKARESRVHRTRMVHLNFAIRGTTPTIAQVTDTQPVLF